MKILALTKMAAVTAIYVAVTLATPFLSYGDIQFRIAEMLVLLVFFRREYALPLILGCALANLGSPLGLVDVGVGTAGTVLSVLGIALVARFASRFPRRWIALALASLFPVLMNGLLVGWELTLVYGLPFLATAVSVAFGELVVVTIVGVPVFAALAANPNFLVLIDPAGRGGAEGAS